MTPAQLERLAALEKRVAVHDGDIAELKRIVAKYTDAGKMGEMRASALPAETGEEST